MNVFKKKSEYHTKSQNENLYSETNYFDFKTRAPDFFRPLLIHRQPSFRA